MKHWIPNEARFWKLPTWITVHISWVTRSDQQCKPICNKHTRKTITAFCYRHEKTKLVKVILQQPPPTFVGIRITPLHTYIHTPIQPYQSAATCTPLSPVAAKAFSLYIKIKEWPHIMNKRTDKFVVYTQQQIYVVLNVAYMDLSNVIGQCLGCPALALPKCKMYFNKLWYVSRGMKNSRCFWWQVALKYSRDLIKGKHTEEFLLVPRTGVLGLWYVEWRKMSLYYSSRGGVPINGWYGKDNKGGAVVNTGERLCYWVAIHVCNGIHINHTHKTNSRVVCKHIHQHNSAYCIYVCKQLEWSGA